MKGPIVLTRVVSVEGTSPPCEASESTSKAVKSLHLAMIGCETKPPYGPLEHTANLLMDLISLAAQRALLEQKELTEIYVIIDIYNAQAEMYPDDWDEYDGVLLPGSFSAAYDLDPWIIKLCEVLQEHLVQPCRPTLGICFGHQVLAHSFSDGNAAEVPSGSRAGRGIMSTTPAGRNLLFHDQETIDMYFSHGDMVEKLPSTAVRLAGTADIPILAAAYFASENEAAIAETIPTPSPFAITFQAHPEYASSLQMGVHKTLDGCMSAMEQRGHLSHESRIDKMEDAVCHFDQVLRNSVDTMLNAGRLLGWYPSSSTTED